MKSVLPPGSMEHMLYATDVFFLQGCRNPRERQPWTLFGRAPPTPPEPEMSFPCGKSFSGQCGMWPLQWGSGWALMRAQQCWFRTLLSSRSVIILQMPRNSIPFFPVSPSLSPQPGSPQVFQYWHRFSLVECAGGARVLANLISAALHQKFPPCVPLVPCVKAISWVAYNLGKTLRKQRLPVM